jgi:hypothetical protein
VNCVAIWTFKQLMVFMIELIKVILWLIIWIFQFVWSLQLYIKIKSLIFLKTIIMNIKNHLDNHWGFIFIYNNQPVLVPYQFNILIFWPLLIKNIFQGIKLLGSIHVHNNYHWNWPKSWIEQIILLVYLKFFNRKTFLMTIILIKPCVFYMYLCDTILWIFVLLYAKGEDNSFCAHWRW